MVKKPRHVWISYKLLQHTKTLHKFKDKHGRVFHGSHITRSPEDNGCSWDDAQYMGEAAEQLESCPYQYEDLDYIREHVSEYKYDSGLDDILPYSERYDSDCQTMGRPDVYPS